MKEENVGEGEEARSQIKTCFEVEAKAVPCV